MNVRSMLLALGVLVTTSAFGQNVWSFSRQQATISSKNHPVLPFLADFAVFNTNPTALKAALAKAPLEAARGDLSRSTIFELPMPDGTTQRFLVSNSPILSPNLRKQIPVDTFAGRSLDDPDATARFDLGPNGFHGYIYSRSGDVVIEPTVMGSAGQVVSYYRGKSFAPRYSQCLVTESVSPLPLAPKVGKVATVLKTYRLAMNATGEYTAFYGSQAAAQNGVVTSINRVVGVYERDLAISMTLVYNMCYTNSSTDPFTNNSGGTMLGQNQTNLDTALGNANYDIGHVFSTGGGGVAGLRVVGVTGQKARGVTGSPAPIGDAFDIDYVAHEMGHQYGGNHTFNGTTGSCGGGNRAASAAYEPGSGSTIMAYAGICGSEDLQSNSDAYFHVKSLEEIFSWKNNAGSGGTATTRANEVPVANAGASYTIPTSTPFKMTGSATDPDGPTLSYCWEQYDLGTAGPSINLATSPLFRSRNPLSVPTRFFPRLPIVLAGTSDQWERLPSVARTMNFRMTVRDNAPGGGGTSWGQTSITVSGSPFTVNSPTSGSTWPGGSQQTVTWTVGGGSVAANVNIYLSTDGGNSYGNGTATLLAANTPNDGSEIVTVPVGLNTGSAKIIVEAAGNVFYNVSPGTFVITPGPAIVVPNAFTLNNGFVFSGGLADLQNSDDQYLVLQRWRAPAFGEWVEGVAEAVSPNANPSRIDVQVESKSSYVGVTQYVEVYNYAVNVWQLLDSAQMTLTDNTRVVSITSSAGLYVQPGTNKVAVRISYGEIPNSPRWLVSVDQIRWAIYP